MIELIALDMDGVLTDLVGSLARLFNVKPEDAHRNWPRGEYDLAKGLAASGVEVSTSEMWARIDDAGEAFWYSLEPLPWAFDVLSMCQATAPTVILTSPSLAPHSASGKVMWLQRHLGRSFRDFLIGPGKAALARPAVMLVDDSDKNIADFENAGGMGWLFGRPWNANHAMVEPHVKLAHFLQKMP